MGVEQSYEITTITILCGPEERRKDITPYRGELLYTEDTKLLYVGDGVTAGGSPVAAEIDEDTVLALINQRLDDGLSHNDLADVNPDEHKDHSQINVNAGNGITGGGSIDETVNIELGQPGIISGTTENSLFENSHTHKIAATSSRDEDNETYLLLAKAMKDHIENEQHGSDGTEHTHNHDNLEDVNPDEHINHTNVTVTGTGGLEGGGDLTESREIELKKPGTLNGTTSNNPLDNHTHEILVTASRDVGDNKTILLAKAMKDHLENEPHGDVTQVYWGNINDKPETATRWPEWGEVTSKPTEFTPESHNHTESDISDLDKYTKSEVDSFLDGKSDVEHSHTWEEVENKPDLYTQSEIDSLISGVEIDELAWEKVTDKPDLYTQSEIDGFLDGKSDVGHGHDNYLEKTQNLSDLDNKPVALQTLTNANTDHIGLFLSLDSELNPEWKGVDDISVEWSTLANVPETATRWPEWGEVTDKPTEFTPESHNHTESDISDLDKYTKSEVDSLISGVEIDELGWDKITDKPDLYNKSEIDTKLDDKADENHDHDNQYLQINQNLSDLDDKNSAFQHLTNANSELAGKFLTLDENGYPQWDEVEIDTELLHEHTIDNDFSNGYGKRYVSTDIPDDTIGNEGDIWLQYDED